VQEQPDENGVNQGVVDIDRVTIRWEKPFLEHPDADSENASTPLC
jgi:hypothetical protein